jgi:hypothetical protein
MGEVVAYCSTRAIGSGSNDGLTSEFYKRQIVDERRIVNTHWGE